MNRLVVPLLFALSACSPKPGEQKKAAHEWKAFDLNSLQVACTIQQADSIHKLWQEQNPTPQASPDNPRMYEDHYYAWRQSVINTIDDQGRIPNQDNTAPRCP